MCRSGVIVRGIGGRMVEVRSESLVEIFREFWLFCVFFW